MGRHGNETRMKKIAITLLLALLLAASTATGEEATQVVLSFAGDCTLGSMKEYQGYASHFVTRIAELGFAHPFSGVSSLFATDDLTLVNLEGTFTNAKKSQDKAFVFKAPPAYAEILPLGSVEAVNIANNHINDFLKAGKEDTIAALEAHGILYSGEGLLAVYEVKGIKIGMTGYSYPHTNTLKKLEADIATLRAEGCDIIIFSMHAGTEEQYKANREQRNVAQGAIDLGVDVVVGHHPHVLQGIEVYENKPIFYSLGNFAFGGNINPKDWDTMVMQVVIEKDENGVRPVEMRIIPCLISGAEKASDFCPVIAEGDHADAILRKVQRYSTNVDESLFKTGVLRLTK